MRIKKESGPCLVALRIMETAEFKITQRTACSIREAASPIAKEGAQAVFLEMGSRIIWAMAAT
jgi:hypothetical protein